MAFRMFLEGHFKHFWVMMARWLSGCVWTFILSISCVLVVHIAFRMFLEAHVEHFLLLVARLLSGFFWRPVLSISGCCLVAR